MRTQLSISALALAGAAGATGASAQSVEPSALLRGVHPVAPVQRYDSGCGLQREGDGLLALGRDYKATLDAGGMTFVPALGGRAPRLFPVGFELSSIERGGEVVLGAPAEVAPRQDGLIAVYDRENGIQERYEAIPGGLEQSFVFPSEPGASGDLVVRGRVATELEGASAGAELF